ncbi:hypothetical protein N9Z44_00110 [Mariniblastus sp.]|nr:hypothetical protein [Mariniblastus sp.]
MIQELVFTSAPKGLKLGSSGFCTVASTPGMAPNLAKQLQGLSAYRHLNSPGSTGAKSNPVVYSHVKIKIGGKWFSILSRIADAGLDYSNRSNKLAHHFAVENTAALKEGPSSLLKNESQFFVNWNQDPTKLEPRSLVGSNSSARACHTWKTVTGDGGWAGDVIEAVQKKKTVYLIVSPTTPVLELIDEVLALLPFKQQWDLTFSTFYTKTSGNIECNVRCVMDGSPEVALARRSQSNVVIDLTSNQGMSKSEFAGNARHGITFEEKKRTSTPIGSELSKIEPDLANFFKPDLNEQINSETPSLDSKINANPPVLTPGLEGYRTYQESSPPTLTTNYRPEETSTSTEITQSKSKYPLVVFCAVLLALILSLVFAYPQFKSNFENAMRSKKPELEKPELEKPELEKPELEKPELEKSELEKSEPRVLVRTFEDIEKLQSDKVANLKQIRVQLVHYEKNPNEDNRNELEKQLLTAGNIDGKELFNKIDLANEKLEKEIRKPDLRNIKKPADIEYAYSLVKEKFRQLIDFREKLNTAEKNFDQEENEANFKVYRKTLEDISKQFPDKNWNGKQPKSFIENLDNRLVKTEDIENYSATNFGTPNHRKGGKVLVLKSYDESKLNFLHASKTSGPGWKLSFEPKDGSYRYKAGLGGADDKQKYYENLKIEFSSNLQKNEPTRLWLASPRNSQIYVKVSVDPDPAGGIQIPHLNFEIEKLQEEKKEVKLFEDLKGKKMNQAFLGIRLNRATSKPEMYWTNSSRGEISFKTEIDKLEKEWEKKAGFLYADSFGKQPKFQEILTLLELFHKPSNPQGISNFKRKLKAKITQNHDEITSLMQRGLNATPPPANVKKAEFIKKINSELNSFLTVLENNSYKQFKEKNKQFRRSDWSKEFKVFRLEKKNNRGDIWIICYLKDKPNQDDIDVQIKKEKQNIQKSAQNPQSNNDVSSLEENPWCG